MSCLSTKERLPFIIHIPGKDCPNPHLGEDREHYGNSVLDYLVSLSQRASRIPILHPLNTVSGKPTFENWENIEDILAAQMDWHTIGNAGDFGLGPIVFRSAARGTAQRLTR